MGNVTGPTGEAVFLSPDVTLQEALCTVLYFSPLIILIVVSCLIYFFAA